MSAGQVLRLLFWVSVAGTVYAYVGYPLLLLLLARIRPRPVQAAEITPNISLIITVHNAGRTIASKLENTLALDYPRDRLEILVASDASTDDTDRLAAAYAGRGVTLCRAPSRGGKTAAQNLACRAACGDVLVFSDATTVLPGDALRAIVRPFADPTIGLVSGEDATLAGEHAVATGEGLYVRYDMWVRRLESLSGSLVGASGCFYAVRRELRSELSKDLVEDFATPLLIVQAGAACSLRAVGAGVCPQHAVYPRRVPAPRADTDRWSSRLTELSLPPQPIPLSEGGMDARQPQALPMAGPSVARGASDLQPAPCLRPLALPSLGDCAGRVLHVCPSRPVLAAPLRPASLGLASALFCARQRCYRCWYSPSNTREAGDHVAAV